MLERLLRFLHRNDPFVIFVGTKDAKGRVHNRLLKIGKRTNAILGYLVDGCGIPPEAIAGLLRDRLEAGFWRLEEKVQTGLGMTMKEFNARAKVDKEFGAWAKNLVAATSRPSGRDDDE